MMPDRQLEAGIRLRMGEKYGGDIPKLKASPNGGARIMMMVITYLRAYGPRGVPNG
tara:strand:+ start:1463 stop:1630 length:168 start_codon:yes stop_codon:yes gene_type:complete